MGNGIIAILDSDADYALKLAEYFNQKSGLNYSVSVFTDYESLEKYLSESFIEVLLISEEFRSYVNSIRNVANIFVLTEGNVDSILKQYHSLYKYQPTDCILRDVMSCYASSSSNAVVMTSIALSAKIIGIYSPVKRCGKTSFAIAYGCIASLTEPSLYINLEEYPGFSYFVEERALGDLSDLLYFYRQNPGNIDKKLLSLSHTYHNLTYIPPMQFSYDIKNMEGSDLTGFIDTISKTNHFQNIILDISDSVKDVPELLSICDTIYMPTTDDAISKYKIDEFFQSTASICMTPIQDKTEIITLPFVDSQIFSKPSENSRTGDFMEALLFSELGVYIRNLRT